MAKYIFDTNIWLTGIIHQYQDAGESSTFDQKEQQARYRDGIDSQSIRGRIAQAMKEDGILVPECVIEELKKHAKSNPEFSEENRKRIEQLVSQLKKVKIRNTELPEELVEAQDELIRQLSKNPETIPHKAVQKLAEKNGTNRSLLAIPGHNHIARGQITEEESAILENVTNHQKEISKATATTHPTEEQKNLLDLKQRAAYIQQKYQLRLWTDFAIVALAQQHNATFVTLDRDPLLINNWLNTCKGMNISNTHINDVNRDGPEKRWKEFIVEIENGKVNGQKKEPKQLTGTLTR